MRTLATTAGLIIAVCVAITVFENANSPGRSVGASPASSSQSRPAASTPPVPVIVELFTSEGCSSCPPADELLMQLEDRQPIPGAQVLALEEHVDYWNQGGWFDPFSSSEVTVRQQRYAESLGRGGSPYTPQMIVDGQSEFVGSHADQAVQAITAAARQTQSEVTVSSASVNSGAHGEWAVRVNRVPPDSGDAAEVWLAVTETRLHSSVGRGENAGRELIHAAVVRQLTKLGVADPRKDPPFSYTAKLTLHREWNPQNLRLVVFVQQKKSRRILGAASAKLTP